MMLIFSRKIADEYCKKENQADYYGNDLSDNAGSLDGLSAKKWFDRADESE